jgi:hypothetical protein
MFGQEILRHVHFFISSYFSQELLSRNIARAVRAAAATVFRPPCARQS